MEIRALTTDDVVVFRVIRLRALAANPEAFEATYATAVHYDDDMWRSRLAGFAGRPGQLFVADDGQDIGGMVGVGMSEQPGDCVVWGMWVEPATRGAGVGTALLDAAVGWARERGAATVTLRVMRANEDARVLYERYGFTEQPEFHPSTAAGSADKPCLRLSITPGVRPHCDRP